MTCQSALDYRELNPTEPMPEAPATARPATAPISTEQRAWIERALTAIDDRANLDLLIELVNIANPTGEERPMAEHLESAMRTRGLASYLMPIDSQSANVVGRYGNHLGPSILFFAPLDSAISHLADEEVPWAGPAMRPDMLPHAVIDGERVLGMSAVNPKAHIVAIVAAISAVAKANIPLTGRAIAAFGAGGAPSNKRPANARYNVGHGAGCEFLLQQGVRADFAVVAKPGYSVQWEEVGIVWFRVRVHGTQTYVGRKHVFKDDNPIVHAAKVIEALERWIPEYSKRHTSGLVGPQGAVGAIEGGWRYKPSFPPAACDLYVDLRISPRAAPMQVWREMDACLEQVRTSLGIRIDNELIVAVDGPATDPENWIVRSGVRAWEETEGRTHAAIKNTSGQTEAVILRRHGIPTARIGLPTIMSPEQGALDAPHSVGVAEPATIRNLASIYVRMIIDTCTRSIAEVGL